MTSAAFQMIQGDALTRLREMPSDSVHCVVTSPPYYGLRDYKTGRWEGGRKECHHLQLHGSQGKGGQRADRSNPGSVPYRDLCGKCGAVRVDLQIGLERTIPKYLSRLVEVFREVRRVLRPDGTMWVNMGDSYASDDKWGGKTGGKHVVALHGDTSIGRVKRVTGLKPKDACLMPARLAIALQDDGWWVRQDIIWHKPNPMPESVRDRCTKAHEYLFLLTKSKRYWWDFEAMQEAASSDTHARTRKLRATGNERSSPDRQRNGIRATSSGNLQRKYRADHGGPAGRRTNQAFGVPWTDTTGLRNTRSVWTVSTQPCSEAHFATFPVALVERCILAGCPKGGIVVDPFAGAGSTGLAAVKHDRLFKGIELSAEYIGIAYRRYGKMFDVVPAEVASA